MVRDRVRVSRDVVMVSTSRSQDVLTPHFSLVFDKILNVLVSSQSQT